MSNKKELRQYLAASKRRIAAANKHLKIVDKEKKTANGGIKANLILDGLATEKDIIDELSENLDTCCAASSKKNAKKLKKQLSKEIKEYNVLTKEWAKLTKQKLPVADTSIPDYIVAGKAYQPLPNITLPTNTTYAAASTGEAAINKKELKDYLAISTKRIKASEKQLKTVLKAKKGAENSNEKASCVLAALAAEKSLVDELSETLDTCCAAQNKGKIRKYKKELKSELKGYNTLTKEWKKITGQKLPMADVAIPEYIIAGKEYQPLPNITLQER